MNHSIDEKDLELLRREFANVNPLHTTKVIARQNPPDPHPRMTYADEKEVLQESLSQDPSFDMETGDELCFVRPGIQHQVVKKLRRGQYACHSVLDLHGLYVREAHETLIAFLQSSRLSGNVCVRIIHGKGRRSPHGRPVLKNKIFNWLRQREEVLAFCSARRQDGGTGAIYVLLKR